MHFLVNHIEKGFPDMMDFASELIHVAKAARGLWRCPCCVTEVIVFGLFSRFYGRSCSESEKLLQGRHKIAEQFVLRHVPIPPNRYCLKRNLN